MTAQGIRQQVALSAWGWFATLAICWCLGTLLSDRRYLVVAAGLLGLVVAAGAALRLTRAPRSVVLPVQLVAAVELAVLTFTDEVLPTLTAYDALVARFTGFVESAQSYTAPMPSEPDTTMAFALIVLAVGLIVDAVGVTLRRVPVLGLLFLLIYMVPVAHRGGDVSVFSFLPGAVGFVFMLAADEQERLTHWGRQIRTVNAVWRETPTEVDDSGLRRSRLRIGFGAVAIAALLPLLIPSVDPRILFDGGTGGDGSGGGGSVGVDDPSLDMRRNLATQSDEVLLRVTSESQPAYLRLAALDEFTGDAWHVGDRSLDDAVGTDDPLPRPPGGTSIGQERIEYEVEVTDALDTRWLPTIYAARDISIDSPWLVDPTHFDVRADSDEELSGSSYQIVSAIPDPTLLELRAAGAPEPELDPYLSLPELPAVITDTAETATAGTSSDIDRALALQDWFRRDGGYTYSLDQVEGDDDRTGLGAVEAFLDDRVGYCEQYASAMALMARHLGIPSRVVVGFLRPERTGSGPWEFHGYDMHAWPELYFEGVGWQLFEPTPPSVSQAAPSFRDSEVPTTVPTDPRDPLRSDQPTRNPRDERSTPVAGGAGGASGDDGPPWGTVLVGVAVVLLLLLLLATPRLLRDARTRRRWQTGAAPEVAAESAWAELRDGVVDLRLAWAEQTTPRQAGRTLRTQMSGADAPDVVDSLNRIVLAVEQARFARMQSGTDQLRADVEAVLAALREHRSPAQVRRATWWPVSLWRSRERQPRRAQRPGGAEQVLTLD